MQQMSLDLHLCPPHPPAQVICTSLFHHLTARHPLRTGDLFHFRFCISLFLYLITRHIHTCKGESFLLIAAFHIPLAEELYLSFSVGWLVVSPAMVTHVQISLLVAPHPQTHTFSESL